MTRTITRTTIWPRLVDVSLLCTIQKSIYWFFFVIFQTGAEVAKISLVGASLTNAGLVLGLGNPTARSNDQTKRGNSGNVSKRYIEKLDQKCS